MKEKDRFKSKDNFTSSYISPYQNTSQDCDIKTYKNSDSFNYVIKTRINWN